MDFDSLVKEMSHRFGSNIDDIYESELWLGLKLHDEGDILLNRALYELREVRTENIALMYTKKYYQNLGVAVPDDLLKTANNYISGHLIIFNNYIENLKTKGYL